MGDVKYTEMGTRFIMLKAGGTIGLTNDEEGVARLSVRSEFGEEPVVLHLTAYEALTLAEYLIVGAKPGSGKEVIDMSDPDARRALVDAIVPALKPETGES